MSPLPRRKRFLPLIGETTPVRARLPCFLVRFNYANRSIPRDVTASRDRHDDGLAQRIFHARSVFVVRIRDDKRETERAILLSSSQRYYNLVRNSWCGFELCSVSWNLYYSIIIASSCIRASALISRCNFRARQTLSVIYH